MWGKRLLEKKCLKEVWRWRNLLTLKEVLIRKRRLKKHSGVIGGYGQYLHDKVWKIKRKKEKTWKP